MAPAGFYSFELFSLRVLGESCLEAPKFPLDEYFSHGNVYSY